MIPCFSTEALCTMLVKLDYSVGYKLCACFRKEVSMQE